MGEEDAWIPVNKGEALKAMISTSVLKTIPDSGHLVIEEKPDALLDEIFNFLHKV